MYQKLEITDVYAREILDSRGNPTIETEVLAGNQWVGRASVPSGASTGTYEAKELRDGGRRYGGKGVRQAVDHVNEQIAGMIIGMDVYDQKGLDALLCRIDGTTDKSNLGANATLSVSMAAARAAAKSLGQPLYRYLGGAHAAKLPVPMMNILNGGRHADNTLDFQEFMIVPSGAESFEQGLEMCVEVYHTLKYMLKKEGYATAVGDEGGFAPDLEDAKAALQLLSRAVEASGYRPGTDIVFAVDAAASELYDKKKNRYVFQGERKQKNGNVSRTTEEMIDYYSELVEAFPLVSIEDALQEEDFDGWELLTARLGMEVQLVGDDLFVTNVNRLKRGIRQSAGNAILIKINQIGTLSEAIDAVKLAKQAGYRTIISHRSGETKDTMIADLAVALESGQIKTGAPCRSERVEKYNRLLKIRELLGEQAVYENPFQGFQGGFEDEIQGKERKQE